MTLYRVNSAAHQSVQLAVTTAWTLAAPALTLVELLVAMTVTTIVGAALIQVMLAQNRSSGNNEAWRVARAVSRGSLNRLLADLRPWPTPTARWRH